MTNPSPAHFSFICFSQVGFANASVSVWTAGTILGIVLGCLALIGLVGYGVYYHYQQRQRLNGSYEQMNTANQPSTITCWF